MKQKRSGAIILSIVLVIIAMAAGIGIGFVMGKSSKDNHAESAEAVESTSIEDTVNESETTGETQTEVESVADNQGQTDSATVDGDDSVTVLTVDGNAVTMNEINVRLYILRNHYIEVYGEDPWNQTTDSGVTVAEEAKATLEDEIIRAELCMEHASELGINVTDEIKAMCLDDAQKFLDDIGPEISEEFGLTLTAEQNVNIKYEVVTAVTNVLSDQARETLLADEANQSLSDADLELKISESVQAQFDAWKEASQVDYSDVWAQIVVGSVG